MKKMQGPMLLLVSLLMGYSATLHADDTDIYVDNATNSDLPNVLLVMDNGANFSANAKVGCTAYTGTNPPEAPSLGTTTGAGIEQCALVDAINALPDNAVNIGLLVSNANNFAASSPDSSKPAWHELCTSDYGGCLLRKLTKMDAAGKASLIRFIKSWTSSGNNSDTAFNIKVNTATPATMMQEAWAYYMGKVGLSGKDYAASIVGAGCQKNFVIYVANGEKTPAIESNPSPFDGANALTSAQVGATAGQKAKIAETLIFKAPNSPTCGATSVAASSNTNNWSENWADEWARLMHEQDGGAVSAEGLQSITTYSIAVVNENTCTPDYPALMSSMADYGGGKYFKTSTATEIATALNTILNEVQAVNSVFSSASLPVSVNAEGSYLNQIYLGMFRPDASGSPRWMGNLKQYQLIRSGKNLIMGDALGNGAISSAGTGFISPNAVSFWTIRDDSKIPDSTGGFFKNVPADQRGALKSPYDSPDGEVVEKGGVAQQLRIENITSTFTGAMDPSTNPRRLYTYCPAGGTCTFALTDAANQFSTANNGIAANAFGASTTVRIVSIVRTGTSALVTTNGNHGFTTGTTVTISNVAQPEYNVTQAVTVNSATSFTITGLPDYPTSPSQGAYTVTSLGGAPTNIASITRTTSTSGGKNTETATVVTSTPHGFTSTANITVLGASASAYNFSGVPSSMGSSSFTFSVTVDPPASPANSYVVGNSSSAYPAKTVTLSRAASNTIGGTTSTAHGFWVGQSITISGTNLNYDGTWTILTVPNATSFTADRNGLGNPASATGSVTVDFASYPITLSRVATTDAALATATGAPALVLGSAVNATRTVNITKLSGTASNESAYVKSDVTITCLNASCTSFTYPITVTPASTGTPATATTTMTVSLSGSSSASVPAGNITRSGATATVSGVPALLFSNGQTVNIAVSGSAQANEAGYVGTWVITCPAAGCTSFTFGPVPLTPDTPATGTNMQAFSGSTPPDRDTVIRWLRGQDNYGDEKGPGGTITVRGSVHGDVLHSRPLVVNYGDSRGIVVFYGSNDGVYRAVNGNQTAAIGTVPAGGEMWGLVLPEHFNEINRQRLASPELKFPGTMLASAQPKDYFVDGGTGAYQKLKADGTTIDKAYLFLTMRRGGRFMYGLDVSDPAAPVVMWKIDTTTPGFEELGQTWSRPRVTLLQGGGLGTTPVLVFAAGYDQAEDSQPPGTDTMGRGIYALNALTGALIWSATKTGTCATGATCLAVPGLTHAIPSDLAFVDRDGNGYIDKLYFGDMGGNIWRADVSAAATADWTVTKLAALGCGVAGDPSPCPAPRKFFFPPSVLTVRAAGALDSFDAISIASGDREHPLKIVATGSSYNVKDKFFMILDRATSVPPGTLTANITGGTLFDATTNPYAGTGDGFFISFNTAEKAVNAPTAVNGQIYFATNRPIDRANSCVANLGEAKAYAVSPFLGTQTSSVLPGGGLPPSAVSGVIIIGSTNADGTPGPASEEKFCIGCGVTPPEQPPCNSALENCSPVTNIPKNLRRTYWYRK